MILEERQVATPGYGPSGEDLILGIRGLHAGGVLGHGSGESATSCVVGYLKDGAVGESVG